MRNNENNKLDYAVVIEKISQKFIDMPETCVIFLRLWWPTVFETFLPGF